MSIWKRLYFLVGIIYSVYGQNSIPLPTEPQLVYEKDEITALTCLDMPTFIGGGNAGCNSNNWVETASKPTTFDPQLLNISNWVDSYKALGVKSAVLTVKHVCGFVLWPTKTIIPSTNNLYNYSIEFSLPPLNGRDIANEFATILQSNGIGHGYYYSLASNFYLNVQHVYVQNTTLLPGQIKVTQQQFQQIATDQLTELFTNYGNITEFWFDGGTGNKDMVDAVTKIINKYQPNMAVFNGQDVTQNMIKWVGTESGGTTSAIWSLGKTGTGDPNSSQYCPTGCDTTLQNGDEWFYSSKESLRTLSQLINVYHNTVGNNCVLEMDFAVDTTGNIAYDHAARYKQFGDWIRNCYGNPLNSTNGIIKNQNGSLSLSLNGYNNIFVDRVMIKEDISFGQRIRNFSIIIDGIIVYQGTSVGNKKIVLMNKLYLNPKTIQFVSNQFVGQQAYISQFSVFKNCTTE